MSAALITLDLFTTDDALITRDTETGLDWLARTSTRNLSYKHNQADVGGWISLAYRNATGSEVCGFLATYAQTPAPCPTNNPVFRIDGNLVHSLLDTGVVISAARVLLDATSTPPLCREDVIAG